jgi:hypothetical protein
VIVLLLFAFGLTCATVIIHALGTWGVIVHLVRDRRQRKGHLATEIHIICVVSVMLLLHLIEAGIWAGLYLIAGVLPDLETAIYFSLTSYTTTGYGDVVLPAPWRLLGPIEGAVGILMFGWSTAVVVTVITRIAEHWLARGTEAR